MKCALQYTPSVLALRRQTLAEMAADLGPSHRPGRLKPGPLVLWIASMLLVFPPAQVRADDALVLNMSPQALADALLQIGRQAQVEIAFSPGQVREKQAVALQGELTVEQALDNLLAPWGLAARQQGARRYTVVTATVPKGLSVLEPVRVFRASASANVFTPEGIWISGPPAIGTCPVCWPITPRCVRMMPRKAV